MSLPASVDSLAVIVRVSVGVTAAVIPFPCVKVTVSPVSTACVVVPSVILNPVATESSVTISPVAFTQMFLAPTVCGVALVRFVNFNQLVLAADEVMVVFELIFVMRLF